MAVTAQKSAEIQNVEAAPQVHVATTDWDGRLRARRFTHAQSGAGDANSTVDLVYVPPGKVRLHLALSRFWNSAFGAGRTLDIGHTGYEKPDGTSVSAAAAAFVSASDVAAAGNANMTGVVGEDETFLVESKEGTTIQAKVAGGTIPDGAELKGEVYFQYD